MVGPSLPRDEHGSHSRDAPAGHRPAGDSRVTASRQDAARSKSGNPRQPLLPHARPDEANGFKLNLEKIQTSGKNADTAFREDLSELYRYKKHEKAEAQKRIKDMEDLKEISQKCKVTIDAYDVSFSRKIDFQKVT